MSEPIPTTETQVFTAFQTALEERLASIEARLTAIEEALNSE